MKTIKLLMALLPLLSFGGCYTQLALRSPDSRDYEEDRYAYQNYDDTVDVEEDSLMYQDDQYYDYRDYRNYRRFYLGYYPDSRFYFGLDYYYNPFWYSYGYYRPWYSPFSYPGY